MRNWRLGLSLIAVFCISCDVDEFLGLKDSGKKGTGPAAADEDSDEAEYDSPKMKEYAQFAGQFADALVKEDFAAAHALGSSHLKSRMTVEQMAEDAHSSYKKFGKPIKAESDPNVQTDPEDLAGPDHKVAGESALDAGIRKVSSARAVGEIPKSVPIDIRKASVELTMRYDPRTIPDFEKQTGLKPEDITEDDEIQHFLTVVIVEESGKLGVAHYFRRFPDIWD